MDWPVQENGFVVVPDKMNKVHIRFRSAWNGIDSDDIQFNAELTTCEVVLHHFPDEIGF